MLRAKVKITDLKTGQESFLLVTKMNLKGLLVESARTLPKGSAVRLSLQVAEGGDQLQLRGEVHKIAKKPGGGRGMIIRFVDPDPATIKRISSSLVQRAKGTKGGESQSGRFIPSQERTAMVDLNTLSRLTLSHIDDEVSPASTLDEEAVHAEHPGLAGATRVGDLEDYPRLRRRDRTRSSRLWFVLPLLLLVLGAFAWLFFSPQENVPAEKPLPETTKLPSPTSTVVVSPGKTPAPDPSVSDPAEEALLEEGVGDVFTTRKKKPATDLPSGEKTIGKAATEIRSIAVEDSEAFVKITVEGTGSLSHYKVSRARSPKRMIVEFSDAKGFTVKPTIPVGKNPLFRIRTNKSGSGIQLALDLYPVKFPRYEVKERPEAIDIFLYR